MNILIVGNVLKDVYLNLDTRGESLETDSTGIEWLDLGFNASSHHFFNRTSTFGGAAVSLEVLEKLGQFAQISGSDFSFDDSAPSRPTASSNYRYILTTDTGVTYFAATKYRTTPFVAPSKTPDYLYIDRSASLDPATITKIHNYLAASPSVKLILYYRENSHLDQLLPLSSLVFIEESQNTPENPYTLISRFVSPDKIITLTSDHFSYNQITERVSVDRIDTMTHLSVYSIAAATILGAFLLGKSVEVSLRLARLNVENSTLSSTLSLSELLDLSNKSGSTSLELIAATLMTPGKGILAADESGGSIHKKFASLRIPDTFKNRHAYRDIFFTTKNLGQYLNGVILFDETARDHMANGDSIPDYLTSLRIIPGIKVDEGLATFDNSTETYTKGLDNLPARLKEYHEMGLRFAKWRSAFTITSSEKAIIKNCYDLAIYASECQKAGLVPIVEPELIYDGDYSIEDCAYKTSEILDTLFAELKKRNVNLRACILKCNMVLSGKQSFSKASAVAVGRLTADVLREHVPSDLAGVVFLSGGQTPEQATKNLAAILENGPFPWPITFSFARALQEPALYAWRSQPTNVDKAREAFENRLIANTKALK
ncbi:fructose-bisphosphate aldolase class I [Candidatus Saccharibacteria bacterium]|nr:fructose-bisphosphate aldolase class I [Candidatus Saccharibacteria bacterium]